MAKTTPKTKLQFLINSQPLEKASTCRKCKCSMPKGHVMSKFVLSSTGQRDGRPVGNPFWSCGEANCLTITHDQRRANRLRYLEQAIESMERKLLRYKEEKEKMEND